MMVKMTKDQKQWIQSRKSVFVFILVAILLNISSTLATGDFSMNHYLDGRLAHGLPFYSPPPFLADEGGMKS